MKTPSLRSPSVIFLCNLAVSDLLVGLVVQPVYIVEQMVRIVPKLQEAVGAMRFAGCGVSLSTMTAITVDRFFALHYHLQHPNLMKTSRAIYTIITIRFIITLFSFSILWSPFGLLGLFHQDLPNCSPASVANSRSTTSSGKFN